MSSNNLTKSASEKDQNDNNICKKHATRCDKDSYRSVCPSKLSKRELEDLYYSLLENNLELKRTINAQNEKNRILSTKVQRMTAQTKVYTGKDCCAAAKAVINEQKAGIADLTKANEALADRIRRLSTQLCSAKQFLKQNPSMRSCYRCFEKASTSKHISATSLNNKQYSTANLKSAAPSTTQLAHEPTSMRTAATNTLEGDVENVEKMETEIMCSENKCRSIVEQFKQNIEDLEEELAKTHTEYSSRMTQLESQVSQLQAAALRARSEQSLRAKDSMELVRGLRTADAEKAELETRLSMEKRKVSELEMRLKSAELSQQVANTVQNHLSTAYQLEEKQLHQTSVTCACSNYIGGDTSPRPLQILSPTKTPNELTVPEDRLSKSDDSGYVDQRREGDSDDKNNKTNQEMMKKIEEMQLQLDALKSLKAEKCNAELDSSSHPKILNDHFKSGDNKKTEQEIALEKGSQVSISKPGVKTSKELLTEPQGLEKAVYDTERRKSMTQKAEQADACNETHIPGTDFENSCRNVCDKDCSILSDEKLEENNTTKEQAVKTDASVPCGWSGVNGDDIAKTDSTSKKYELYDHSEISKSLMVSKEDHLNLIPSKDTEHGDNCSINLPQKEVAIIQPKPFNHHPSEKANLKTSIEGSQEDLSTNRDTNINRTQKTLTTKPNQDNVQQIPKPCPITSDSAGKRRPSLTKRKAKNVAGKRKIEVFRDQNKEAKKKNVSKNPNKDTVKKGDYKVEAKKKDLIEEKNDARGLNEVVDQRHVPDYKAANGILNGEVYESKRNQIDGKIYGEKKKNEFGSVLERRVCTSTPKADRVQISPHTYTIPDESRANSPANTEHEISVMTDLPSERDDTYDRLSPGEHRTFGTSTETCSPQNGYTLSEGEVPVNLERRTSKSIGEVRKTEHTKDISYGEQTSAPEQMEATLQAISLELARCRMLLQTQRPMEAQTNTDNGSANPLGLVLRKTDGQSHFDGTATPSCVFILHIVTVVLTDEALLRSRNACLILKWRFDHKTTMTPLVSGRVSHFDFSTQYQLKMTHEVVEHFQHENMLIMIEGDDPEKPFASCSLSLRQVLLNINKRIDLSLPLRAGPYLKDQAHGFPQTSEDVGVIDVWCMLLTKQTAN